MKSKTTAAILALLLGGLGIHKFYLGRAGWGIVYLIFAVTFIPAVVAFIEGILLLLMSEDEFNKKYNTSQYIAGAVRDGVLAANQQSKL